MLMACLLITTITAQAQFEKGTWLVNPALSGLNLSYNTGTDSANFGFEVKGGAFLMDNVALLVNAKANWAKGTDIYRLGVGGRYYFDAVGVFLGANVNLTRYADGPDKTRFGFGAEAGYAFFLSKSVTLEPAFYWDINKDRSDFGIQIGFGIYL